MHCAATTSAAFRLAISRPHRKVSRVTLRILPNSVADRPLSRPSGLNKARFPALCILGTNDPTQGVTPRDRVAEVVSGPYPEVTLIGAGHWL